MATDKLHSLDSGPSRSDGAWPVLVARRGEGGAPTLIASSLAICFRKPPVHRDLWLKELPVASGRDPVAPSDLLLAGEVREAFERVPPIPSWVSFPLYDPQSDLTF